MIIVKKGFWKLISRLFDMDAKRHMQRNALVISTLMALYPLAYSNPGETELPTGANIVAGDIHIETTHTPD